MGNGNNLSFAHCTVESRRASETWVLSAQAFHHIFTGVCYWHFLPPFDFYQFILHGLYSLPYSSLLLAEHKTLNAQK